MSNMEINLPPDPGNDDLIAKIRQRIRMDGRITFAAFMEMALYDPEYGYYTCGRETVGTSGDFLTSPMMHHSFGQTIARWLEFAWRELGTPGNFDIVEMGAGKGLLRTVILDYLAENASDVRNAARYRIIEKSRSEPPASLSAIPDASITGCLFSNELVDALPVHLVTVEGGRLQEIFVSARGDRFIEEIDEPSTPDIPEYFDRLEIKLPEEYRTEVNLNALGWMNEVGSKLARGFVITIDYGYTADQYYSPDRRRGTLLCYYRHTWSEDPYARIGRQDITAHVDFTSLMHAGAASGLVATELTTQRDFLIQNGIREQIAGSDGRRAIMALIDPRGMGGFRVLVQQSTAAEPL
jgi:SAM-dependent MidA family methyltransferase